MRHWSGSWFRRDRSSHVPNLMHKLLIVYRRLWLAQSTKPWQVTHEVSIVKKVDTWLSAWLSHPSWLSSFCFRQIRHRAVFSTRSTQSFFHDMNSGNTEKDEFESLAKRKSNWTPPEGQFVSVDLFIRKCRHDIRKLNFSQTIKFSNLTADEWAALKSFRSRKDVTIKPADKGGDVVVWRTDLYKQEAARQLADSKFYVRTEKDLTLDNQKVVKTTINELISNQKLPSTARNLVINTPRTSHIYFLPQIHKTNNPGRPIVSACSCPTELISSFLDKKMASFVQSLPTYIKDTNQCAQNFRPIPISGPIQISIHNGC